MLRCAAVCCSVLQCGITYDFQVRICCSVLQCGAVCCSVVQCVVVCCSVLQCVVVCSSVVLPLIVRYEYIPVCCNGALCCNSSALQNVAV